MGIRKILVVSAAISFSAFSFSFEAMAQQERPRLDDSFRQLQEQWKQIMKNEYNPATIQPVVNHQTSFSDRAWLDKSKRTSHKKTRDYARRR